MTSPGYQGGPTELVPGMWLGDCLCFAASHMDLSPRSPLRTVLHLGLLSALSLIASCAPEIGDACENSVDCDIQNKRICDLTQPGGYCTVRGCERGTCPDDSVCVMFRPAPERLAASWCMASCDDDDDCRDHYNCTNAEDMGSLESGTDAGTDAPAADSLDSESAKFCSAEPLD